VCPPGIPIRLVRLGRPPVADTGSRMERQQAYVPERSPHRLLSDEAMQYVTAVPAAQQKYAQDSLYNGEAAKRLGSTP
jgi:hypothetical protein